MLHLSTHPMVTLLILLNLMTLLFCVLLAHTWKCSTPFQRSAHASALKKIQAWSFPHKRSGDCREEANHSALPCSVWIALHGRAACFTWSLALLALSLPVPQSLAQACWWMLEEQTHGVMRHPKSHLSKLWINFSINFANLPVSSLLQNVPNHFCNAPHSKSST